MLLKALKTSKRSQNVPILDVLLWQESSVDIWSSSTNKSSEYQKISTLKPHGAVFSTLQYSRYRCHSRLKRSFSASVGSLAASFMLISYGCLGPYMSTSCFLVFAVNRPKPVKQYKVAANLTLLFWGLDFRSWLSGQNGKALFHSSHHLDPALHDESHSFFVEQTWKQSRNFSLHRAHGRLPCADHQTWQFADSHSNSPTDKDLLCNHKFNSNDKSLLRPR